MCHLTPWASFLLICEINERVTFYFSPFIFSSQLSSWKKSDFIVTLLQNLCFPLSVRQAPLLGMQSLCCQGSLLEVTETQIDWNRKKSGGPLFQAWVDPGACTTSWGIYLFLSPSNSKIHFTFNKLWGDRDGTSNLSHGFLLAQLEALAQSWTNHWSKEYLDSLGLDGLSTEGGKGANST